MEIILNDSLVEESYFKERSNLNGLTLLANGGATYKKEELYKPLDPNFAPVTSLRNPGLIGLLSHAYCYHLKVAIAPHDMWSLLIADLSKYITKNPETFRQLFTDSQGKKTISIFSPSLTEIPMDSLSSALAGHVKFDASILHPNFSTNTPIIEEYFQALFCDMASSYYDYSMFCCGIKAIKLLGTKEDWALLRNHFIKVATVFGVEQHLIDHFENVKYILGLIVDSFTVERNNFWLDIFTQKNVGSGGDLVIDGWISDLFIVKHKFKKITNFINDTATVQYTQVNTREKFVALYGGFNYRTVDGYIELDYAKHIFKLEKVAVPVNNASNFEVTRYEIEQRTKKLAAEWTVAEVEDVIAELPTNDDLITYAINYCKMLDEKKAENSK